MNSFPRNSIRCFGVFEVDVSARELRKGGLKSHLPEQAFQLLVLLLEQPGEVVSRDDMKRLLWPAGTHVDFNHGVNKAVNRLRAVLGDSATHPHLIETVPRRGYRLITPVSTAERCFAEPLSKIRLAVLPFVTLGADQDHFTEGLTEELIAQLGRIDTQRLGAHFHHGVSGLPQARRRNRQRVERELPARGQRAARGMQGSRHCPAY